jgi:hypothetical protein
MAINFNGLSLVTKGYVSGEVSSATSTRLAADTSLTTTN